MTFKTEADPIGPVCKTRRPIVVSKGKIRSKVVLSQPAKIEMFPVSARWHPPETGQSTASPPRSITIAPMRLTSASSVVDISIQILPGPTSGNISCMTASLAAGFGRQVITASQVAMRFAALFPSSAPAATLVATKSAFKSCTATATPLRIKLPESFPPTLPKPMNPTFIRYSPVWF